MKINCPKYNISIIHNTVFDSARNDNDSALAFH